MKSYTFITILLAIFFGIMAGLAGQIIGQYYFSHDLAGFSLSREFDLLEGRSNLIIRDPRKVVVSKDAKIEETKELIDRSFFKLFNLSSESDDYIVLDDYSALAMAVSSDGWLMAFLPPHLINYSQDEMLDNFKIVSSDRQIYSPTELHLFSENDLNILFLKMKDLDNVNVLDVSKGSQLQSAQSLLTYKSENQLSLASLIDLGFSEPIFTSDSFNRNLSINTQDDFSTDSFVFDLSGDFVGFLDSQGDFHDSSAIEMYWRSFLRDKEIKEPFLGIHYLNLSYIKFLENNYSRGAMIYGNQDFPAFLEDSPAEDSGLIEGDVIVEIDGLPLNKDLDLADHILNLNPGDEILLDYYRQGEKDQVSIILQAK